ncbi:MAG TPA: SDR family NAD(P)-dependent oxidoreductase, partial [Acidimicrobiia bacterium]|nr:SDR family NAD(P)-dependent oxidoreductase [Acidimicrobiia bacterium]
MRDDQLGLDGRTIVVAGAGGGGIGTAICAAIVNAGGRVVAIDNDVGRLASATDLGETVIGRVADARDHASVDRALDDVGPLYGLVHIAGGLGLDQWERTERMSLDTFDDVLALNQRAAF